MTSLTSQVIGSIVAAFGRASRHRPCFFQHDLVRMQQARNLDRCLFATLRRPGNECRLGDIVCHRDAHAAQELNALGDFVDKLVLFVVVLVEQEMQLIKVGPATCQ